MKYTISGTVNCEETSEIEPGSVANLTVYNGQRVCLFFVILIKY